MKKTMGMKFGGSDRQWVLKGWWRAALPVKYRPDEFVRSEIHKDALCIHIHNKIGKVTNESTQGKLNTKHLGSQVPYADGYESWGVWVTIPSWLKKRKEAREMQCFDHFLARNSWQLPLCQKGHIARHTALGCARMLKQDHFGNAKRWLTFGKRHKIASWLGSKRTAWNKLSRWYPHASQISSFPSYAFHTPNRFIIKTLGAKMIFTFFLSNHQITTFPNMALGRLWLHDQPNLYQAFTVKIASYLC